MSATDLIFGAKYYDDVYVPQGFGKVKAYQTLVGYQPCLKDQMWLYGGSGSQFITNATAVNGQFHLGQLVQEMVVTTGHDTSAITLDEVPFCQNTAGVYSYDGGQVKEWTRPIRNSLGTFATEVALTADYQKKYIIGGTSWAIDVLTGKLFDFSTSGFLFTSRTLSGENYRPFGIGDITFSIQFSTTYTSDGSISWWTKVEDDDWLQEDDLAISNADGLKTRITTRSQQSKTTVHKFAIKLTALSSNIYIRSIDITVAGLAHGDFSA